jgi:hypothetical protein
VRRNWFVDKEEKKPYFSKKRSSIGEKGRDFADNFLWLNPPNATDPRA